MNTYQVTVRRQGTSPLTLTMLVVGGMNSLSGAVLGVVILSAIIQLLRWFEKGVDIGGTSFALPLGVQEIAIGVVMIVILMFRPSGLTRNKELLWPHWPFKQLPAGRSRAPTG